MKIEKNAFEWSVFGASIVVVAAVIAYLVIAVVRGGERPPDLSARPGNAVRSAGGWAVPVVVRNGGDETAEMVKIEVVLMEGDRVAERAELTLAFVPRQSRRNGWVVFRRDPACCRVVARAVGFEQP